MGIEFATLVIVVALLVLIGLGVPLGLSTLMISIVTALAYYGLNGLFLVSSNVFGVLENYSLIAVPLFVFMASILESSGIAKSLFDAMSILGGRAHGSVAMQTCVVAVILAAMSGIMGGEIVMLGMIALPQMFRLGYDRKLAIGVIVAAGSLATLIPPSIVMIIYGLTAEVSISDLFLGGAVPGLMLAGIYMLYIFVRSRLNPAMCPINPDPMAQQPFYKRLGVLKFVILPLMVIGGVLGSIYAGIASVTEAAAIGTVGAMLAAAARGELSFPVIRGALRRTAETVGAIIWLVLGAISLVGIYNLIGGNSFLRGALTGLDVPPLMVIFLMMLIVMVLGTFMEWIAIIFITIPIFAPVVADLGYDPIWFGVLFAINLQIYYLSPPFGPACFFLKSVAPADVTLQEIFLAVLPFIGLQVVGMLLVMFFPDLALWLPRLVNG